MALALMPGAALAHVGTLGESGVPSGLAHPVGRPDHVPAMVAAGLPGARKGTPAIRTLLVAFPMVMALGGLTGLLGVGLAGATGAALAAPLASDRAGPRLARRCGIDPVTGQGRTRC